MGDALGFGFNAKNLIFGNKTMVLFQMPPCVFQLIIIIKGGKTQFFWVDALDFFNANNPNKTK